MNQVWHSIRSLLGFLNEKKRTISIVFLIAAISYTAFLVGGSYVVWIEKKDKIVEHIEKYRNEVDGIYQSTNIQPIRILDKNGRLIGQFSRRKFKPIRTDNLDQHGNLVWALLASEDREFFEHSGINYYAVFRAALTNLYHMAKVQGGSTISQQLAKLTLGFQDRTIFNKLTELYCTFYLERHLDKPTILSMYMNQIFLGENNVGMEDASRYYFNKRGKDLSPAEAAMLVGAIPAPSVYNPVRNLKIALDRQRVILYQMAKYQNLHPKPVEVERDFELKVEANIKRFRDIYNVREIEVAGKKDIEADIGLYGVDKDFTVNVAPDFNYEIRQYVMDNFSEEDLENKGLTVYTTLDSAKQQVAVDALREGVEKVKARLEKTKKSYSAKGKAKDVKLQNEIISGMNGSMISINPQNGYVESLVGSYKISSIYRLNRAISAIRQPGSAIKGLVYALAFEKRIVNPSTIVVDEKININGYSPRNWYKGYQGEITVRTAFAQSVNTISVKLLDEVGIDYFLEKLGKILGLSSDQLSKRFDPYLSLALGSGGLSPLELATIYSVLANNGKRVVPRTILRITDKDGNELYSSAWQNTNDPQDQIIDPVACAMTINLMQAVLSEGGTMHIPLKPEDRFPMAGKTGTVQSPKAALKQWGYHRGIRDAWFVGLIPDLVTTVWVGNDRGAPFPGSGSSVSGSIWFRYANYIAKNLHIKNQLITPFDGNYVRVDVCADNGSLLLQGQECKIPLFGQYYYIGEQPKFIPKEVIEPFPEEKSVASPDLEGEEGVELDAPPPPPPPPTSIEPDLNTQ